MSSKRKNHGFSLVELVIVIVIVGLLAAIAIPRFSRGAAGAADSALSGDLAVLRNAIEMYAAEHGGMYPDADAIEAQLTTYSDLSGTTNAAPTAAFEYGPYLHALPNLKAGTYVGSKLVGEVTVTPAAEVVTDPGTGWLYNETTGQIWANETSFLNR